MKVNARAARPYLTLLRFIAVVGEEELEATYIISHDLVFFIPFPHLTNSSSERCDQGTCFVSRAEAGQASTGNRLIVDWLVNLGRRDGESSPR